jgi:hypothetical protein
MCQASKADLQQTPSRGQWPIRSLLFVTTIVAACAWLSTLHRGFGIAACLVTGPAMILAGLSRFRSPHSEGLKLWTFASLVLAGATGPPLVLALPSETSNYESLLRMAKASFSGVVIAAGYGFYLLLTASIFESAYGLENRLDKK